jgi:DNA transformation protein
VALWFTPAAAATRSDGNRIDVTISRSCPVYTRAVPTHPDFASHCADLLGAVGAVRTKRMFGGHGVYVDDVFVAIVTGDSLYLKTDDQTQPRFTAAGGTQFCFAARGKLQATHFWSAPADAMDSPALMRPWAQLAFEAALRARAKPKMRR